jgi:hypothetical protein
LLEKKNSKEMKRKIWKKINLICIRVQEKRKKQVRKCVAEGFPPFIVEDFYTGKFGWEVERCLHVDKLNIITLCDNGVRETRYC